MELAVDERHPDVDHRIARDHALGHVVSDPFLDRHTEVLRDGAAEDLVLPHEALASLGRRNLDHAYPVLAVAARLLDVPAFSPAVTGDSFAVRDPGNLCGGLDSVLALELLQRHVEVDVPQAGDDQLLGLLHSLDVQRGVLLAQPRKSARDLLLVSASLGRDRHAVGRARKLQRWQRPPVLGPQRVAGEGMAELGGGADVAGADFGRGHVLLASRKEDLGETLLAAPTHVREVHVRLDRSGHDLEVADAPELVASRAEDERLGRLLGLAVGRWQQLADGRHERPHAQQLRG